MINNNVAPLAAAASSEGKKSSSSSATAAHSLKSSEGGAKGYDSRGSTNNDKKAARAAAASATNKSSKKSSAASERKLAAAQAAASAAPPLSPFALSLNNMASANIVSSSSSSSASSSSSSSPTASGNHTNSNTYGNSNNASKQARHSLSLEHVTSTLLNSHQSSLDSSDSGGGDGAEMDEEDDDEMEGDDFGDDELPSKMAENTGRWTAEEHRLFLAGLDIHGKGWKKIAMLIQTRTVVQIRTHAQKYFQKLQKARQNGDDGEVMMEGRNAYQQKKKRPKRSGSIGDLFVNTAGGASDGGVSTGNNISNNGTAAAAHHPAPTSSSTASKPSKKRSEKAKKERNSENNASSSYSSSYSSSSSSSLLLPRVTINSGMNSNSNNSNSSNNNNNNKSNKRKICIANPDADASILEMNSMDSLDDDTIQLGNVTAAELQMRNSMMRNSGMMSSNGGGKVGGASNAHAHVNANNSSNMDEDGLYRFLTPVVGNEGFPLALDSQHNTFLNNNHTLQKNNMLDSGDSSPTSVIEISAPEWYNKGDVDGLLEDAETDSLDWLQIATDGKFDDVASLCSTSDGGSSSEGSSNNSSKHGSCNNLLKKAGDIMLAESKLGSKIMYSGNQHHHEEAGGEIDTALLISGFIDGEGAFETAYESGHMIQ
jgi:SHAQKYF class myb-like DNA-binding protein